MRWAYVFWLVFVLAMAGVMPSITLAETPSTAVQPTTSNSSPIPFKQQPETPEGSLSRVGVVLLLAIGFCLVVVLILKKTMQRKGVLGVGKGNRITVVETKRITPKLMTFLIKVDEQEYLVAQSGDQLQLTQHKTVKVMDHTDEQ